jgi:TPP-dependent trihydroxycyclohexane-1,2-dione (THcHDO) dehydratase
MATSGPTPGKEIHTMPRMTGGEAIVDSLLRHGIDTVFGLPGVQVYGLFDAFARNANRMRLINARHEQTTAYMALGYACATGKPAAYAVVPGPGVLNTTAALATAWGVNAPVLCLTGQVPGPMIGRLRGMLHELPDQLATLRTLLKYADRTAARCRWKCRWTSSQPWRRSHRRIRCHCSPTQRRIPKRSPPWPGWPMRRRRR